MQNDFIVQAEPPLFTIGDDALPNASENQTDPGTKVAVESLSLISVDQLLDSVSEAAHTLFLVCGLRRNQTENR